MVKEGYDWKSISACTMCGEKSREFLGYRLNKSHGYFPLFKSGIKMKIWQCSRCGLIFSDPMPVPHSISQHYFIPAETYWKDEYFLLDESYFARELGVLRELKEIKQGMTALDVGAGIGKCMMAMQKAGLKVTGTEPSETFRKKAEEVMGFGKDAILPYSVEEASFPENSFDFITFGAVFEHLYDPATVLKKALGWLKPDGVVHIEVPNADYLGSKVMNLYYRLWLRKLVTHLSPMHPPFHIYEFTLRSFEENGRMNGYSIIRSEYFPGTVRHFPGFIQGMLRKKMEGTDKGLQLCVWLKPLK